MMGSGEEQKRKQNSNFYILYRASISQHLRSSCVSRCGVCHNNDDNNLTTANRMFGILSLANSKMCGSNLLPISSYDASLPIC